MALKYQEPRANRFKKSGKGGFAFAAFLVFIVFLITGGYFLIKYQKQYTVTDLFSTVQKKDFIFKQDVRQSVASSSQSQITPPIAVKFVEPVPPVKQDYYNGDISTDSLKPSSVPQKKTGKAELAIVVDDMGSSLQEARLLAAIGVPINFAIIPGLRHDQEVADFAVGGGIEILVHLPMQPKEYPRRRIESNGLLLDQNDDELRNRVSHYIELLPHAVGANNHMGSGFTENIEKMRVVLGVLKDNNLFFLDSITTPLTVGSKVAKELKMSHARRDVFLDNEQNEVYIRSQLVKVVTQAQKTGHAIAICHPHPETIDTLAKVLPKLSQQGVILVKISRLVK